MPKGLKGFQKGNTIWLGKHLSDETKKKLSKTNTGKLSSLRGKELSKEWREKISKSRIGMKFSDEHRRNLSKSHIGQKHLYWRGKNHFLWKGGITPTVQNIRHCFKYRQWRSDVFTRDDFTCQICGVRGGYLEVDHFPKMFYEIIKEYEIDSIDKANKCEELWNINNGRTVCKKHNPKMGRPKNV